LDFLSEIVGMDRTLPVIIMTAWGNVELAGEAMRRGARDFVQKPWENNRLFAILRSQVELRRDLQTADRLAAENRLLTAQGRPECIATSPSMVPILTGIARIAPSGANVLVTGEHGTGKEIVAQTIHATPPACVRRMSVLAIGRL
jgi:DNA-binding NtrC family response regulator